jgi:hypothetical protein
VERLFKEEQRLGHQPEIAQNSGGSLERLLMRVGCSRGYCSATKAHREIRIHRVYTGDPKTGCRLDDLLIVLDAWRAGWESDEIDLRQVIRSVVHVLGGMALDYFAEELDPLLDLLELGPDGRPWQDQNGEPILLYDPLYVLIQHMALLFRPNAAE